MYFACIVLVLRMSFTRIALVLCATTRDTCELHVLRCISMCIVHVLRVLRARLAIHVLRLCIRVYCDVLRHVLRVLARALHYMYYDFVFGCIVMYCVT